MQWDFDDAVLVSAVGVDAAFYGVHELAGFCAKLCGLRGWTGPAIQRNYGPDITTDGDFVTIVKVIVENFYKIRGEPTFALPMPRALVGGACLMSSQRRRVQTLFDRAEAVLQGNHSSVYGSLPDALFMMRHGGSGHMLFYAALTLCEVETLRDVAAEVIGLGADLNAVFEKPPSRGLGPAAVTTLFSASLSRLIHRH